MERQHVMRWLGVSSILVVLLWACAAPVRVVTEPPPFPGEFMSARWGASVEEARSAITRAGLQWFEDRLDGEPYAMYASGSYLGSPAIFSYFFTPRTKQLYRVDVTWRDLSVYDRAKAELVGKFKAPSYASRDVTHWVPWPERNLVILQKDSSDVQMSYASGAFLVQNRKERE
jgi:hypothetical protein